MNSITMGREFGGGIRELGKHIDNVLPGGLGGNDVYSAFRSF